MGAEFFFEKMACATNDDFNHMSRGVLKLWTDHPGGIRRAITIHDGLEVAASYRDLHPRAPNMQELFRERVYLGKDPVSFVKDPLCLADRVPSRPPSPPRRVFATDAPLLKSGSEKVPLFTTVSTAAWKNSGCCGRLEEICGAPTL